MIRRPSGPRLLPAALLLAAVCCTAALAADPPATQEEAEQRLAGLVRDIAELQQRLESARQEHREGQDQLRQMDLAIQESARAVRNLDEQRAEREGRLSLLEAERDAERVRMREREDQLAQLLVATYRLARESRIKLILNQEDPLRAARLLGFHDYINRAQAARITELRNALQRLEDLYREIDGELRELSAVRQRQQETLETQQSQRADRERLLAELGRQIGGEEARLAGLERDRQDLEQLIARLSDVLADIPADLGQRVGLGERKGRLAMPVRAPVRHAFGQSRGAGLRWQGWLLEAPAGSEVRSIAHGRVAFADWFRGYGLMLIVDHGQGFMSLYGYNESLLWEVGDWVEPGTVIATVGTGPGGEQGLYFELRRDGKAIDPAAWLQR